MRTRSAGLIVWLTTLALVLSACATQNPASPAASTAQSAAPPPSTAAGASNPTTGGEIPEHILNYAYHLSWTTLDPTNSWDAEPDILANIYETLTSYDTTTGELSPMLATSWENNADATEWTFHLREGVKFHDGAPLTAAAVKASFERNAIGNGPAYLYAEYKSIEAVDDLTVKITTKVPQPLDWMFSAGWGVYIVSPDSVKQPQDWFESGQGAGTGPYRWVSYEPNQSAEIERFPEYWGGWQPGQVTRVKYTFVSDAATRQQLLEAGEADLGWSLPTHNLPTLATNPNLKLFSYPILAAQNVLFNTVRAPTDNALVRQALAAAFPTDTIIDTVYGGEGYVTKNVSSFSSKVLGGAVEGDGFTYDLDKARKLLVDAGFPGGGFTIEHVVNIGFPDQVQEGELWKASLSEIGVTLDLLVVDSTQYHEIAHAPVEKRPSITTSWTPDYPSPQNQMFAKFGSTSGANDSSYVNKDFDAELAQGVELWASDRPAAQAAFAKANAQLFKDMPGFPYLDKLVTYVTSAKISGLDVQHCGLLDIYSIRVSD